MLGRQPLFARLRVCLHHLALALLMALLALTAPPTSAQAQATCTISWTNAFGGDWAEPANWDLGRVPAEVDNVCIARAGNYEVTISGAVSIASLSIETTSGTPTLSVSGTLVVSGSLVNGERLRMLGTTISAATFTNRAQLEAYGNLAADLINEATGRISVPSATTLQLTRPGGGLVNRGTITVLAGGYLNLQLTGQTFTQEAGTLTLDGGLFMGRGFFTYTGGNIAGTPNLTHTEVTLGPASGPVELLLQGDSLLNSAVRTGQKVTVSGNLALPAPIRNTGSIVLESGRLLVESGTLTNAATGTLEVNAASLSGSLDNQGTLRVRTSLNLDRTTSYTNTGTLAINAGASLSVLASNATFTQAGGTINNIGAFTMTGGGARFNYEGGTITGAAVSIQNGRLNIGSAAGAGAFTLNQEVALAGNLRANQHVSYYNTLTIVGSLSNAGSIQSLFTAYNAPRIVVEDGVLTNTPTGKLEEGGYFATTISGNLNNQGEMLVRSGLIFNQADGTFFNSGSIEVISPAAVDIQNGTFVSQGGSFSGGTLRIGASGTLIGSGTLSTVVDNSGTLSPGQPLGTLTIDGSYIQAEGGTLRSEIGGREAGAFDRLSVTGEAILAGTHQVRLANYFIPNQGDSFTTLSYGSLRADTTFRTYTGLTPSGVRMAASLGAQSLTIDVEQVEAAQGSTWLALIYLGGDDTLNADGKLVGLSEDMVDLVTRLNSMPYNPAVRIVVLYDGAQPGDSRIYTREPTRLEDITEQAATSPLWLGGFPGGQGSRELNTGSVTTLRNFVSWAKATYPGPRYTMLSLVNHGGGWAPELDGAAQPRGTSRVQAGGWRGMSIDLRSGGSSFSTRSLGQALEGLGPFDVLFLDACLMGMLENAFEVRDEADFLIAGENLLFAGLPYEDYLAPAGLTRDLDPIDLARRIVERYNTGTSPALSPYVISAVDLRQLRDEVPDNLPSRLDRLAGQVLLSLPAQVDPSHPLALALTEVYTRSQKFDYDNNQRIDPREGYVDLVHFARLLADAESPAISQAVRDAAASVAAAATDGPTPAIFRVRRANGIFNGQPWNFDNAFGLSIFLPLGERDYRPSHADPDNPSKPAGAERQLTYYADPSQLALTRVHPRWSELLVRLEPTVPIARTGRGGLPSGVTLAALQVDLRDFSNPGQPPASRLVFLPAVRH